jgi:hypothetical protein
MQYLNYKRPFRRGMWVLLVVAAVVLTCVAQEPSEGQSAITAVAATRPITDLLPQTLAGIRSTSDIRQFQPSTLSELTGEKTPIFLEYGVDAAAAREYGDYRIEVFQTPSPNQAFGLFTYSSPEPVDYGKVKNSRLAATSTAGGSLLWESNFFVRIEAVRQPYSSLHVAARLATEIGEIAGGAKGPGRFPSLPDSLPSNGIAPLKVRYFLGSGALGSFVEHASDMFGFEGQAEAAVASYNQKTADRGAEPLKLLIVEYNTPQFARDALDRATVFAASLSEDKQKSIIIKREGNYIIEAVDVANHDYAQQLVDSVKYPYVVEWLKDPHSRHYDRFAGQKAAQIILSSFGIVGLLLMGAFLGGAIFGIVVFIRRRRRQLEVFSDAGGMLFLDIDRLCTGRPNRIELAGAPGQLIEGGDN